MMEIMTMATITMTIPRGWGGGNLISSRYGDVPLFAEPFFRRSGPFFPDFKEAYRPTDRWASPPLLSVIC